MIRIRFNINDALLYLISIYSMRYNILNIFKNTPILLIFVLAGWIPDLAKEHRFDPAELTLPASERVRVTVHNLDAASEEFESKDLRIEKTIPGDSKVSIWVGPLLSDED